MASFLLSQQQKYIQIEKSYARLFLRFICKSIPKLKCYSAPKVQW